ncbi:hypothetical protein [Leptolyngbya sp. 7M]|uniref:hypothetical protein n=1 Tax=Leptolyngbya sp. 7M TaxID=2812896 RepID=UPI001B8ACBBC|nr:hypothetical protein [Leptolyngbya sp. 7M]QYO67711.1 hypothetical protein JVX88_13520 [Leptolyngbya sp. 7M]
MNIRARKNKKEKTDSLTGRLGRVSALVRSEALIIAALIVGVYFVSRSVITSRDPVQVRFVDNGSDHQKQGASIFGFPSGTGFSGKAIEAGARLREAGALGVAVSLSAFATFSATGNPPATTESVLRDLVNRRLLPPGIGIDGLSLQSELSLISFRYIREPFSFEIVSLPKDESKGPALLLKFPLPPGEPNSVVYFQSSNVSPERIPAPFSTTEQLAAAGWNIRHWRGDALPLDESVLHDLREQDAWLKAQNQSK